MAQTMEATREARSWRPVAAFSPSPGRISLSPLRGPMRAQHLHGQARRAERVGQEQGRGSVEPPAGRFGGEVAASHLAL